MQLVLVFVSNQQMVLCTPLERNIHRFCRAYSLTRASIMKFEELIRLLWYNGCCRWLCATVVPFGKCVANNFVQFFVLHHMWMSHARHNLPCKRQNLSHSYILFTICEWTGRNGVMWAENVVRCEKQKKTIYERIVAIQTTVWVKVTINAKCFSFGFPTRLSLPFIYSIQGKLCHAIDIHIAYIRQKYNPFHSPLAPLPHTFTWAQRQVNLSIIIIIVAIFGFELSDSYTIHINMCLICANAM